MKLGNLIFYVFWGLVIIGILIVLFRKMFSSEEKSDSCFALSIRPGALKIKRTCGAIEALDFSRYIPADDW